MTAHLRFFLSRWPNLSRVLAVTFWDQRQHQTDSPRAPWTSLFPTHQELPTIITLKQIDWWGIAAADENWQALSPLSCISLCPPVARIKYTVVCVSILHYSKFFATTSNTPAILRLGNGSRVHHRTSISAFLFLSGESLSMRKSFDVSYADFLDCQRTLNSINRQKPPTVIDHSCEENMPLQTISPRTLPHRIVTRTTPCSPRALIVGELWHGH